MKTYSLFLFLVLTAWNLSAQNSGNSHFFKFVIQNENQEILLIKFDGFWEVPGARYKGNITIQEFLDKKALDHGIEIQDAKLGALVTFHHDVRDTPTMMFYYKADYKSGELKTPKWGDDLAWFSREEAYKVIPYSEMNHILQQMNENQNTVLQGALRITYDNETKQRTGFTFINKLQKIH